MYVLFLGPQLVSSEVENKMGRRFESNYSTSPAQFREWVDSFNRDGHLFLENFLTIEHVEQLAQDLGWSIRWLAPLDEQTGGKMNSRKGWGGNRTLPQNVREQRGQSQSI